MGCIVTYDEVHEWMAFANLVIQIAILLLIGLSLLLKKKKKFVWHGNVMLVAVLINGVLLLSHMGPSLIYLLREEIPLLDSVAFVGLFPWHSWRCSRVPCYLAGWHLGLRAIRNQILHKKEKVNANNLGFLDCCISLRVVILLTAHNLGLMHA